MDDKKKPCLFERIMIWIHNESEAQKITEENLQDIPETVGKVPKSKKTKILP
jgi:hypothetical protein